MLPMIFCATGFCERKKDKDDRVHAVFSSAAVQGHTENHLPLSAALEKPRRLHHFPVYNARSEEIALRCSA